MFLSNFVLVVLCSDQRFFCFLVVGSDCLVFSCCGIMHLSSQSFICSKYFVLHMQDFVTKTMSSRLHIWSPKTLFCIIDCIVRRVEFEIGDGMRDRMSKLEIV
jgi:hypothetical protein